MLLGFKTYLDQFFTSLIKIKYIYPISLHIFFRKMLENAVFGMICRIFVIKLSHSWIYIWVSHHQYASEPTTSVNFFKTFFFHIKFSRKYLCISHYLVRLLYGWVLWKSAQFMKCNNCSNTNWSVYILIL